MSFDHKAYEIRWDAFSDEFAPILTSSLSVATSSALVEFIAVNLASCSNPYDGEPLTAAWKEHLEAGGVQELADFALTKYYRPNEDFGLGGHWTECVHRLTTEQQQALLGETFGPPNALFDPGFQGSYFQSPARVAQSAQTLAHLELPAINEYARRLAEIATKGNGLYVTF